MVTRHHHRDLEPEPGEPSSRGGDRASPLTAASPPPGNDAPFRQAVAPGEDVAGYASAGDASVETDQPGQPLPPLPDGGLAAAMPSWLLAPPDPSDAAPDSAPAAAEAAEIDPTNFLTEDDLPAWLRVLVDRDKGASASPTQPRSALVIPAVEAAPPAPRAAPVPGARPPRSAPPLERAKPPAAPAPSPSTVEADSGVVSPRLVPGSDSREQQSTGSLLPTLLVLVTVLLVTLIYLLVAGLL